MVPLRFKNRFPISPFQNQSFDESSVAPLISASEVLTCLPQSLCSWDFHVHGTTPGPSVLTFNFFTEQGGIKHGLDYLEIRKHGIMSGHWTLERRDQQIAEARKPNALFRRMEILTDAAKIIVQSESAFTRSFEILQRSRVVGSIRPVHPLTRRAFVQCSPEVPELSQLFAFWLAALMWRRQANNQ